MKYSEIQAKREQLEAQVAQAKEAVLAAEKDLKDFDEGLADAEICFAGDPCHDTKAAKPAPKPVAAAPKAAAKKTKAAKPVAAPAPKPKKTASATAKVTKAKDPGKPVTVTAESKKNASAGRNAVARGDRPPLKKAIVMVMGTKVLNTAGVIEALEAKDWMPSSGNLHQYISYMLSSNCPDVFERTERRGYYRVRPGYKVDKAEVKKAEVKAEPKKGNGKKAKAAPKAKKAKASPKVDEALKDAFGEDIVSGNVENNPFDTATV